MNPGSQFTESSVKSKTIQPQRNDYPIALGVSPPPGWQSRAVSSWRRFVGPGLGVLVVATLLGWFIFQGPGARFFRSLNYNSEIGLVTIADSINVTPVPVPKHDIDKSGIHEQSATDVESKQKPIGPSNSNDTPPTFQHIQTIFQSKCANCHSMKKQKGGLDLSTLAKVMKGGESGPAIVAGKPIDSPLWDALDMDRMPPDKKKRLTATEKEQVKRWIEGGAR